MSELTTIWYIETVNDTKEIRSPVSNYIRSCVGFLPLSSGDDVQLQAEEDTVSCCKLTLLFQYHQLSLCIPSECQLDICLPWPVLHPDRVTPDHIICFTSILKRIQFLSCSDILHELSGSILWSIKPFVLVSLLSFLRYLFWESNQVNLDVRTLTNDLWIIQQQLQIQSLYPWAPVHH